MDRRGTLVDTEVVLLTLTSFLMNLVKVARMQ